MSKLVDEVRAAMEMKRMKGEPYNPQEMILKLVAKLELITTPKGVGRVVLAKQAIADLKKELGIL